MVRWFARSWYWVVVRWAVWSDSLLVRGSVSGSLSKRSVGGGGRRRFGESVGGGGFGSLNGVAMSGGSVSGSVGGGRRGLVLVP